MKPSKEVLSDFRNHLWACFKYLGLGEPTPAQYAMADALQHGPKDMQLQAGRGFGKSVITSCLASWFLLKDPNTTILVISATGMKATEFISMTRRILDLVPYCKSLRPGDSTVDNAFAFNVEARTKTGQDKSCFARGITSQITGSHAEYIIFDDVEIEGNCETPAARSKLLNKCLEAEQIRNPGGRIIFLGTPQIKDSIYIQLSNHYEVTKFPAVMPDKTKPAECENVNDYIWSLDIEVGEPTQPERFPKELLLERMAKVGPTLFSLHYKLDTSLADAQKYPLRLSDLIVVDLDPFVGPEKLVWASSDKNKSIPTFGVAGDAIYDPMWVSDHFSEYDQTIMTIDPSGRGKDDTDVCIASTKNGYVFIHELVGIKGNGYASESLQTICKLINQYNINLVRVESNFGDAMYVQILRPEVAKWCGQIGIEEYRVGGQKETRILKILEPVFGNHRLVFNKKAIREEETQRQITRINYSRGSLAHDDRIDVLSAAVSYYQERIQFDVDEQVRKREEDDRQDVINQWLSDKRGYNLLSNKTSGAVLVNGKPLSNKPSSYSILKKSYKKNMWRKR